MELKLERVGAWCGVAMLTLFFITFALVAGLVPPLPPQTEARDVAEFFVSHGLRVRLGAALTMLAVGVSLPFWAAICVRVRRVEGRWGVLAITQIMSCTLALAVFMFPMVLVAAAAFRPDQRPVEITQALNDVFWLMFVGTVTPGLAHFLVLAIAAFVDRTDPVTFPRWFGWLSVVAAIASLPDVVAVVFTSGPLSWSGAFAWWIPLAMLSVWMIALVAVMLRSISAEQTAAVHRASASGLRSSATAGDEN
ncbi:hypothetical protein [Mycobacterium sp.]|uniref:hypothetical protein n=1 Tax=Mycobacterium sp. TaxID=1785 RepID=UPI003F9C0238